jgi:hypothetical protein
MTKKKKQGKSWKKLDKSHPIKKYIQKELEKLNKKQPKPSPSQDNISPA